MEYCRLVFAIFNMNFDISCWNFVYISCLLIVWNGLHNSSPALFFALLFLLLIVAQAILFRFLICCVSNFLAMYFDKLCFCIYAFMYSALWTCCRALYIFIIIMRVCWENSAACWSIAAASPQCIQKSTPTSSSHSSTVLFVTYIAWMYNFLTGMWLAFQEKSWK